MSCEADWILRGWQVLVQAALLGPLVSLPAWDAGVAALRAAYAAGTYHPDPTLAAHARDRLETLETYASRVAVKAQGNGRVPYRVREADWSLRLHIFDPLLHSVTKDHDNILRKAFIAPAGYRILRVDWHASHLFLLAGLSGDPVMADDLLAADIYLLLGHELAPGHPRARDLGKLMVLATTYRAGAETLCVKAQEMGIELTEERIKDLLERLRQRFSVLWAWGNAQMPMGNHLLWTPGWRRGQLRPDEDRPPLGPGISAPPALPTLLAGLAQGWEADALFLSLAMLAPHMERLGLRLVLHLHDCSVWEVKEETAEEAAVMVANTMLTAHAWIQRFTPMPGAPPVDRGDGAWIGAPLDVVLGNSWGDPGTTIDPRAGGSP